MQYKLAEAVCSPSQARTNHINLEYWLCNEAMLQVILLQQTLLAQFKVWEELCATKWSSQAHGTREQCCFWGQGGQSVITQFRGLTAHASTSASVSNREATTAAG